MPIGIGEALGAVKAIYDHFQTAAGNSEACRMMISRIDIIRSVSDELKQRQAESKECQAALRELVNCKSDAGALLKKFSETGKLVKLLKARTHEGDFHKINIRLDHVIAGLNLALGARTQECLDALLEDAQLQDGRQVTLMRKILGSQDSLMKALLEQHEKEAKDSMDVSAAGVAKGVKIQEGAHVSASVTGFDPRLNPQGASLAEQAKAAREVMAGVGSVTATGIDSDVTVGRNATLNLEATGMRVFSGGAQPVHSEALTPPTPAPSNSSSSSSSEASHRSTSMDTSFPNP